MTTKKHAATLLVLMLVGLMGLANAQMSTRIKAQVPFDFVANGKTMPAGECTIAVEVNGQTRLSISSGQQHTFALPIGGGAPSARKNTTLVFRHYGNRYFLVAVTQEGGTGYKLRVSRLERELQARNIHGQVFTLLASAK